MRRTETPEPIWIKFCTVVDIADVTYTNFGDHRLRGFWVAGGQISPSPIDFHRRPYNTLALPCERVMETWCSSNRQTTSCEKQWAVRRVSTTTSNINQFQEVPEGQWAVSRVPRLQSKHKHFSPAARSTQILRSRDSELFSGASRQTVSWDPETVSCFPVRADRQCAEIQRQWAVFRYEQTDSELRSTQTKQTEHMTVRIVVSVQYFSRFFSSRFALLLFIVHVVLTCDSCKFLLFFA